MSAPMVGPRVRNSHHQRSPRDRAGAAFFVVPASIDINSSVRMRRPFGPMRAPYRAAPVAIVWASACAGRLSELVGVVKGWEPTISRPGRAIAILVAAWYIVGRN